MKMKRTEKMMLGCMTAGAIAALLLAWFLPGLPWWVYAIVGLLVCGGAYKAVLDQASKETIVDNLKR